MSSAASAAVSQEFGQLLALVRTESAQHPVHRVVMRVRTALGVTDAHAHTRVFRRAEGTSIDLMPLWPPAEPPALTLIRPNSKSVIVNHHNMVGLVW